MATTENISRYSAAEPASAQNLMGKIAKRTNLILGLSGIILFVTFFFYNLIIPQTPGRMTRPTASLIADLPLWSFITSLPLPVPQNSHLVAVLLVGFSLIAFASYALAIFITWRNKYQLKTLFIVIISSLSFFQLSVWSLPNVNTDIYNYILRGRVAAVYNANPYYVAADEFPEDPIYPYASHKYTVKPGGKLPAWMSINILLARIAGDDVIANLLIYRSAFFVFNAMTLLLIGLILKKIKPGYVLPGLLMYAWNPIVVMYGQSKNGHCNGFFHDFGHSIPCA